LHRQQFSFKTKSQKRVREDRPEEAFRLSDSNVMFVVFERGRRSLHEFR
jgi:hypothetical protein